MNLSQCPILHGGDFMSVQSSGINHRISEVFRSISLGPHARMTCIGGICLFAIRVISTQAL